VTHLAHVTLAAFLICTPFLAAAAADSSDDAFSALRSHRCAEAGEHFDLILQAAPDNVDARYGRGLSRLCLGEYDAAVQDLQFAAEHWPEKTEVAFELGAALTSAGSYREAEPWLQKAQNQPDFDGPASLLLGLGQLRLGSLDSSLAYFARAESRSTAVANQARYYSGVAEYRAGRLTHADAHFSFVRDQAADTALGREAQAFLTAIEARRREAYRLFGGLGFEYDSNVVLAPVQDLGPIGQEGDGRFILRAGGVVTPLRQSHLRLDLGYSFFQSLHLELGDFNLQVHEPFADITLRTPWGRAGVASRFQYYLRREELKRFLAQWSVRPFTVVSFDRAGDAELYYRYRGRDFIETQFNTLHLDGAAHAAGLRHTLQPFAHGRFAVGYQFESDDLANIGDQGMSVENQFTNEAHAAIADVAWDLPWEIETTLAYTYTQRDYADTSRREDEVRSDTNHMVTFALRRPLTANIEAVTGYLGVFNDSNQALYEYRRHVAIVALSLSY